MDKINKDFLDSLDLHDKEMKEYILYVFQE